MQGMSAEVLQHSFDPIILDKVGKSIEKKNELAFLVTWITKVKIFEPELN